MNAPRLPALALFALLAGLPGTLDAQTCQPATPGVPVRFVHEAVVSPTTVDGTPARPWVDRREYRDATFAALDGDTLRVRVDGVPAAFHAAEVQRFQVECPMSTGTYLGKGLVVGAVVGGVVGLALGLCNPSIDLFGDDDGCQGPTRGSVTGATGAGALTGAVLGTLMGGLGALLSGGTEWQAVPLVKTPAVTPDGEWTVGRRVPVAW